MILRMGDGHRNIFGWKARVFGSIVFCIVRARNLLTLLLGTRVLSERSSCQGLRHFEALVSEHPSGVRMPGHMPGHIQYM